MSENTTDDALLAVLCNRLRIRAAVEMPEYERRSTRVRIELIWESDDFQDDTVISRDWVDIPDPAKE